MKEPEKMNFPDKIYVHEISAMELDVKIPYSVEYILKDAFINKAGEWLKNNLVNYLGLCNNETYMRGAFIKINDCVEDFKTYMKRE